MRLFMLGAALVASLPQVLYAGDNTVLRYLEFRDGSVLRLPVVDEPWKITVIRPNGKIEDTHIRLGALQSVTLTAEPGFEKKRALLSAVQQLGADDFRDRELGQAALLKMGPTIRADLEMCLQFTSDAEAQARLKHILSTFAERPEPAAPARRIFDLFVDKETAWGHVGDEGIPVLIDGVKYRLKRDVVQAVTAAPPAGLTIPGTTAGMANFRRLAASDFLPGSVEESFEKTPDGRPLRIGENIEKLFVNKGFVLSTSVTTSHVSVNSFQVMGKSKGMSAATHNPLWEGEITIRFCQPGRESVPATVAQFGCWLAAVMPNGTSMVAYDMQGRELGSVQTTSNGHEFLGVSSAIPIHRIRIVPNLQLDRDYTMDDFIFSPPLTTEASHPEKFVVHLADGDRILCGDIGFGKDGVLIQAMPGGLPDRTVKLTQVMRVNVPDKGRKPEPPPPGLFAELRDGSVILGTEAADKRTPPVFPRRPNLLKERDNLAGLWSSDYPRLVPAKATGAVLWDHENRIWKEVAAVRFLEEIVMWKQVEQFQALAYKKLGPLWLVPPSENPVPGRWHVRTRQGDDLVLTQPEQATGRLSRELTALWQGQPLRLTVDEIVSIFQVPKSP